MESNTFNNNIDAIYESDVVGFTKNYFSYLFKVLQSIDPKSVERFVELILSCRDSNHTIFFIGNGGSATTASHFANDFSIGTKTPENPIRALSLCDNNAIITAIANDFGYEFIFSKQLEALANAGDVVVAISASGNSKNLIEAFSYARKFKLRTVAITGFNGGSLKEMADYSIHVPTGYGEYGPAEDAHMILDHLISSYLIRRFAVDES
jgi:D-sedoheptulose 7-phosphate isomerase